MPTIPNDTTAFDFTPNPITIGTIFKGAESANVLFLYCLSKDEKRQRAKMNTLGTENPADIFTKHVERELLDRYAALVNYKYMTGRASSAPTSATRDIIGYSCNSEVMLAVVQYTNDVIIGTCLAGMMN